jgi:hypothetical protein
MHRAYSRGLRSWSKRAFCVLLAVAGVVIAFALPAAARAESVTTVAGEARGMTVPIGHDNYIVVGTFRDSLGFPGTYAGRYHLDTTGYNSCRGIGMGTMYCDNPPYWAGLPYRCNLISGQITFRSLGKQIDLNIGVAFPEQPLNRITSGICEQQEDPSLHDTYLLMWNRSTLWPATTEEFSRGFGPLDLARGSMTGISTPVGGAPVYLDDLALHLDIYAP